MKGRIILFRGTTLSVEVGMRGSGSACKLETYIITHSLLFVMCSSALVSASVILSRLRTASSSICLLLNDALSASSSFSLSLVDDALSLIASNIAVEFPKSEVRGRAENRSSTVARPSTGGASSGKFAPPRSPESLKACRGPARLLHPLPRDSSSSPAPADFSLTRPNQLGSCNETQDISSRIY